MLTLRDQAPKPRRQFGGFLTYQSTCRTHTATKQRRNIAVAAVDAPVADAAEATAVLRQASETRSVPAPQVFKALWQLEKSKLQDSAWDDKLSQDGKRWRLVFTAGAEDVKKGSKSGQGGGFYFPLTAVQRWEKESGKIENGIYLGQLGALAFEGPYDYAKKKLSFDFTKFKIRLGPKWFPFNIKSSKKDGQGPFFLFFYVDDDIACARGRGGGYAIWQRTTADWELKAGVTL